MLKEEKIIENVKNKHKELIEKAIELMSLVEDVEHNSNHMEDVVKNTSRLLVKLANEDVDIDACIIGAYWHDVGRIEKDKGHEELSANMLVKKMKELGYDSKFIELCDNTVRYHKWTMKPTSIEGKILKDADKLAFISLGRWNELVQNKKRADEIIKLLPKLRNEILYFKETRDLYDEDIGKLVEFFYRLVLMR